jgi:hypothetical protein
MQVWIYRFPRSSTLTVAASFPNGTDLAVVTATPPGPRRSVERSAAPRALDACATVYISRRCRHYNHYYPLSIFIIMHVGMGIFRSCFYQVRHRS